MRAILGVVLALGLGACSEYDLTDPAPAVGVANPLSVDDDHQVDRLLQVVEPVVDVLWVIDNSPSMVDDRAALAAAFPTFLEPFEAAGIDWHIGVVTTDMDNENHRGRLQARRGVKWIEPDTPAPEAVFQDMTTRRLGHGSVFERGREAAWTALDEEGDGYNAGFLRDDTGGWLHLTVVTDEDDDSDATRIPSSRFVEFVELLRPYADRTTFNSIVAMADNGPEERGEQYLDLSSRLGGAVFDLNEGNWDGLLDELGGLQAAEPTDEFYLSRLPVEGTLEVRTELGGITRVHERDVEWVYLPDRNSVLFLDEPPAIGSTLEVHYTVASSM